MRALSPVEDRVLAWLLVLLAGALGYFVLLHWWFVAPQWRMAHDMRQLRTDQHRYAALLAQRSALQQRLAGLARGQADSGAFLPQSDPNAAAADLMQRVVDATATRAAAEACAVTQKMPLPVTGGNEPYRKVSVSITLHCDADEALAALLYKLEEGEPYMFVEAFDASRGAVPTPDGAQPPLEVQLSISGYLRQRPGNTP
jgi:general secretion pathway protein M